MVNKTLRIKNMTGFHVELVGVLLRETERFTSRIWFEHKGNSYNAKSLLSVLGAGVRFNDELTFFCEGEDEVEALQRIEMLVDTEFDA